MMSADKHLDGSQPTTSRGAQQVEPYHDAREAAVHAFEKAYVEAVLAAASGNMSLAARIGRMDRTTLYRLIVKHSITVVRPSSKKAA